MRDAATRAPASAVTAEPLPPRAENFRLPSAPRALMMPPKDTLSHAIGAHLIDHDPTVRIVNYTAGKEDYVSAPCAHSTVCCNCCWV